MARHKYADLIHAWADGAEIQVLNNGKWIDIYYLSWSEYAEYRIKPQPKPDYEIESVITRHGLTSSYYGKANVRFVFDGETGALKSAEVLK
jgi:hypothetical protein